MVKVEKNEVPTGQKREHNGSRMYSTNDCPFSLELNRQMVPGLFEKFVYDAPWLCYLAFMSPPCVCPLCAYSSYVCPPYVCLSPFNYRFVCMNVSPCVSFRFMSDCVYDPSVCMSPPCACHLLVYVPSVRIPCGCSLMVLSLRVYDPPGIYPLHVYVPSVSIPCAYPLVSLSFPMYVALYLGSFVCRSLLV